MISNAVPAFQPHPLLRSGHAQTIVGGLLRGAGRRLRASNVHLLPVSEGDRIVLHDDCPATWKPGHRVALLLHGLSGSHRSGYMARVAAKLLEYGVRAVRMDLRGHGLGREHAQMPSHAGRSEDALAALAFLDQLCPHSPVVLVGFSMGGNIVLKLLGELGSNVPEQLAGAVAIAPPIDILSCSRHMLRGAARFYSRRFVRLLAEQLRRRQPFAPRLRGIRLDPLPQSLYDFDSRFTAPLAGFRDAEDYYRSSSAGPLLKQIELPTRIVAAHDDPVVPADIFRQVQLAPATSLHFSRHGGHVGYIGIAGVDPDRYWLDWRIVEWVAEQPVRASQPGRLPLAISACQA